MDVDTAFTIEGRWFVDLVCGQVATNMIQAFFYDLQAAGSRTVEAAADEPAAAPVRRAAVLGAGMMGAGIAYVSARVWGILQPFGDLEASAALRNQADKAFLGAKLGDLGDRADTEALLPTAYFPTALDQHHTEPRFLLPQQLGKHDQVALLEDAQAQRHVREQH